MEQLETEKATTLLWQEKTKDSDVKIRNEQAKLKNLEKQQSERSQQS
jgi:hypothetical protein